MTVIEFDEIVSGFYRAASGAIGWADALLPFKRAMQAYAIYLFAAGPSRGSITFAHDASDWPPEADLDYIRTYHRIDPRANLLIGAPPGTWLNCWENFDEAFVAQDRFYQEFLIPYGGRYVSGMKLLQDDTLSVILGVHRGIGSERLDPREIEVCQRLGRHLADALKLHRALIEHSPRNRVGEELLSRVQVPIALLDECRLIRHLNPAARALLDRQDSPFLEKAGHLHCRRSGDDAALLTALRTVLGKGRDAADAVVADKLFLRVGAAASAGAMGLFLYALDPSETLCAFANEPLVMMLIHCPDSKLELDPLVVAAAFDLTPAEARVAISLARGSSPQHIAQQSKVSVNTIRSQLQIVFQKTATTRQSELVSLLAGLPMAALGLADGRGR